MIRSRWLTRRKFRIEIGTELVAAVIWSSVILGIPVAALLSRYKVIHNVFAAAVWWKIWGFSFLALNVNLGVAVGFTGRAMKRLAGRSYVNGIDAYRSFYGLAIERMVSIASPAIVFTSWALLVGFNALVGQAWIALVVSACLTAVAASLMTRCAIRWCSLHETAAFSSATVIASGSETTVPEVKVEEGEERRHSSTVAESKVRPSMKAERLREMNASEELREVREFVEANPQDFNARYRLAFLKHQLYRTPEDLASVLADYDAAIELNQSVAAAYHNRARCRLAVGNFRPRTDLMVVFDNVRLSREVVSLSLDDLRRAYELDRYNADVHIDRALALIAERNEKDPQWLGEAFANLEVASWSEPRYARVQFYRALMLDYLYHNKESARGEYEYCLGLPDAPEPAHKTRQRIRNLRWGWGGANLFAARFALRILVFFLLSNLAVRLAIHSVLLGRVERIEEFLLMQLLAFAFWLLLVGLIDHRTIRGGGREDLIAILLCYVPWFAIVAFPTLRSVSGVGSSGSRLYVCELLLALVAILLFCFCWWQPEDLLSTQVILKDFRNPS